MIWLVIAHCKAENNGKEESFTKEIARFDYLTLAEEFIKNCLPAARKGEFEIVKKAEVKKTAEEVKAMIFSKVVDMKAKGRSFDYIRGNYGGIVTAFKDAGVITPDEAAEILNDVFEEFFM